MRDWITLALIVANGARDKPFCFTNAWTSKLQVRVGVWHFSEVFIHKPSLYSVWVNRIGLGNGSNVKIEACLVVLNSHNELRFGSLPCLMKSKPLILLLKSTALGFLYKKITINFYCIYYLLSLFKQLYSYNSISRNQFA
jgi:hypothetical protein